MTLARSALIDRHHTPYYHCVSRCVRRAYLCGNDPLTGYNFEHRRQWIEHRLHKLAGVFAIDLCAYAVMSNHYHVVLHLNAAGLEWREAEVEKRWSRLHRIPDHFDSMEAPRRSALIETWRARLCSISWFMKCMNEPLARFANKEDGCKGRFWEGRFRSQALLDDDAVVKCMAYVDLNPVRAQIATTPEESEYTSIRARTQARAKALAPMRNGSATHFSLPLTLEEYLVVVDWTGRQIRSDKRGAIDAKIPPILARLTRAGPVEWLQDIRRLRTKYFRAIGSRASLETFRDRLGQRRLKGLA